MADASNSAVELPDADAGADPVPDPLPEGAADFEAWEAAEDAVGTPEALIVSLDGFEGPLDVLLALARTQKVDLAKISILALADQYLLFIAEARKLRLELAADYLVMAAWLAFLKSKLLLPKETGADDSPSGDELAARLAFRLKRLEAMRNAAAALMTRKRLGRDVFARGMPEGVRTIRVRQYTGVIFDLLKAYADQRRRTVKRVHVVPRRTVWSIKDARQRLEAIVGQLSGEWMELEKYLEQYRDNPDVARTAVASSFGAALEMAREGMVEISQAEPFAPIYMRKREAGSNASVTSPVSCVGGQACRIRRGQEWFRRSSRSCRTDKSPSPSPTPSSRKPRPPRRPARPSPTRAGAGCRRTLPSSLPPTAVSNCAFSRRCCLPPPSRWPSSTSART
jgi:segregation and condensation protein A